MAEATFNLAVSGDDGQSGRLEGWPSWPPLATETSNDSDLAAMARKVSHQTSSFTEAVVALFRWNTSSLPAGTITGAVLRIFVQGKADANFRDLIGEWYDPANWPIGVEDYALDVGTNAMSGADITAINVDAYNDFALANAAANVSRTGYTALRLGISGGDPGPTGDNDNRVSFLVFDDIVETEPRLIVTYDPPPIDSFMPARRRGR